MQKEKFMIYRRDAKKGEATYSPKSHSAPHFVGHYVEGMEEWASWYCFNKKEDDGENQSSGPTKLSLTKPGTKAAIMAGEPSAWIFPKSGSLFLTMSSSNMSLPLQVQSIMVSL